MEPARASGQPLVAQSKPLLTRVAQHQSLGLSSGRARPAKGWRVCRGTSGEPQGNLRGTSSVTRWTPGGRVRSSGHLPPRLFKKWPSASKTARNKAIMAVNECGRPSRPGERSDVYGDLKRESPRRMTSDGHISRSQKSGHLTI